MNSLKDDIKALLSALIWYTKRKIIKLSHWFETHKNFLVEVLMKGRGIYQKRFWHGSIIALVLVGILTSGVFGGQSLISAQYPGIGNPDPRFASAYEPFPEGPVTGGFQDPHTNVSQKPRSEIIEYKVETGDTLSGIAQKFGVTSDTIKWANNLEDTANIKPGQTLKILPVSGVTHTVKSGDTLDSVAKKYEADAQAILDFPYNDVPDDFSLKIGQVLIVPDGSPPEIKLPPKPKLQPQYIANNESSSPTFSASGGGSFIWPTTFSYISTYFAWWHPGIDLPNSRSPSIHASDGGVVRVAGWPDSYGYGNRVVIDHGNGYQTLYAHLSNVYVSVGQTISRGELIGQMGSTGRSTGTHLHFEIHYKGVALNPLGILK